MLSTSAQWLTGSLFPVKELGHETSRVPGTPWLLHITHGSKEIARSLTRPSRGEATVV